MFHTLIYNKSKTYRDVEVGGAEPEGGLVGQHLLGLTDSSGQGQHQSSLIHQLVLVLLVWQHPLDGLFCVERCRRNGLGSVFDIFTMQVWLYFALLAS